MSNSYPAIAIFHSPPQRPLLPIVDVHSFDRDKTQRPTSDLRLLAEGSDSGNRAI